MYQSVDQALKAAYKTIMLRIEPQNNTAQIMDWCESKGVRQGRGELTQHEYHANAAMIIKQVESLLNRYELAAVEMQYTGGLKADGIIDLTAWIERENKGVNLLICDDVLLNLFRGVPSQTKIQDTYDLSKGTFYRQQQKVKGCMAALLDSAICKLETEYAEKWLVRDR